MRRDHVMAGYGGSTSQAPLLRLGDRESHGKSKWQSLLDWAAESPVQSCGDSQNLKPCSTM